MIHEEKKVAKIIEELTMFFFHWERMKLKRKLKEREK